MEEASFVGGDDKALAAFGSTALEEDDAEAHHALEGGGEAAFGFEAEGCEEVGDEVGFAGGFTGKEGGEDAVMGGREVRESWARHAS